MTMTTIWETILAEPRWIAIIGLVLDAVGAVLVAFTAWARMKLPELYGATAEADQTLRPRRRMVVWGAALLVVGFILQGVAAWMQMGHKPPGQWTI